MKEKHVFLLYVNDYIVISYALVLVYIDESTLYITQKVSFIFMLFIFSSYVQWFIYCEIYSLICKQIC